MHIVVANSETGEVRSLQTADALVQIVDLSSQGRFRKSCNRDCGNEFVLKRLFNNSVVRHKLCATLF